MDILSQHRAEIARALRKHKYDVMGDGRILIGAGMNVVIGGAFKHRLYRADGSIDTAIDPNMLVGQGINAILNAFFFQQAAPGGFYVSMYQANATPADSWTAANYNANADEFTAYTQANRPSWDIGSTPTTTKTVGNTGSEALFTFATGGPYNIYGVALHTTAGKEDNTGLLVAASRFATPRLNQVAGDKLGVEYVLTGQDAS